MSHDPALQQVVLEALERIRQVALRGAPQAARFLTYIVEETLAGRGAQLKEYTVAVGALGRPSTFDPSSDAAVRVAARQLRFKLADYYGGAGAADPVVIELPKGTYVPSFTPRVPPSASSPDPGGTTPDEERRPARAPDDRPAASRPSPWSRRAGVAAALLLGIAITAMALWPRTDASGSTAPVVVVLPFANLTGRPDEEFISDGLADEIATAMARSPATRVIARASAWKFKGAKVDIREVGRQLGAGYVIEGSVLRSDTRYRVSVHVSAATDGVRVWSEQYEVERPEVFGLYDTIAAAVHEAVAARVNPSLGALAVRRAPKDPIASALYLEARYYWNQRTDSAMRRAEALFRDATTRDTTFALGWAGLAGLYATMEVNHLDAPGVNARRAREAATRALTLDPTLGEAWAARGLLLGFSDWRWADSDSAFRRAVALSPGYASARSWYSNTLLARGRIDESLAQLEIARQLDPLSMPVAYGIAQANYYGRRWDAGLRAMDRVLELAPGNTWARLLRGKLLKGAGRLADARAEFAAINDSMELALLDTARREQEVPRRIARFTAEETGRAQFWIATLYAQIGWHDSAFVWLDRARVAHQADLVSILTDPMIDLLKGDSRYRTLVAQVGLSDPGADGPRAVGTRP